MVLMGRVDIGARGGLSGFQSAGKAHRAGFGILGVAQQVPHQAADTDFVVDDAGAALGIAVDGR